MDDEEVVEELRKILLDDILEATVLYNLDSYDEIHNNVGHQMDKLPHWDTDYRGVDRIEAYTDIYDAELLLVDVVLVLLRLNIWYDDHNIWVILQDNVPCDYNVFHVVNRFELMLGIVRHSSLYKI